MPWLAMGRAVERPSGSLTWSFSTIPNGEHGSTTGILGGTFDPIHCGHLAAAEQLLTRAGLQEVWLMPNARPPHRPTEKPASPEDRLAMVLLAVAGHTALLASDFEVRRGGVSYTSLTLAALKVAYPGRRFAWLIGYDEAIRIREWHEPNTVLAATDFVIFNRPAMDMEPARLYALGFPPDRTRIVRIDTPAIAANEVRDRVRRGLPVDDLVPAPVAAYIAAHGLYRSN